MTEEIIVINKDSIKDKIFEIRGQKVMLDFHLAEIYGYTTKDFNRQVKNNIEKFDADFRFQLNVEEVTNLSRCKNFTSMQTKGVKGGRVYMPYAFTEQGIYMLMTVLKGELATKQSKAIIRLFKEMKDYIIESNNFVTYSEFAKLSLITSENSGSIKRIENSMVNKKELSEIINELTDIKISKEYLVLDGEKVEGDLAYKEIYSKARKSIYIIDNYISLKTLVLLKDINKNIKVIIFTDNINNGLHKLEYDDFYKEYQIQIKFIKTNNKYHDRYIIIDYKTKSEIIYHSGPSSKDIGNRIGSIMQTEYNYIYYNLIDNLLKNNDLILK